MSAPVLRRALTLRDLIVYGLLFIGPLAPVGVFGVLDAATSGAVALVYIFATLGMAFTAWSYAEMSRVVPHAGSVFAYATQGLGRPAGFLAGWLAMLDYLLIPSVAYLFSGIALHALVPSVPTWVFTSLTFAVTMLLNFSGVRVAARAGFVVVAVEIVVLAIFVGAAVVVLTYTGPERAWMSPLRGTVPITLSTVVGAISIAVLSYLGFDAVAGFAEENAGEARNVGRAILICLAVSGLVFVVQTYLAAVLSPATPADLAARPGEQGTAFYDVAREAIGPWMATLLALTKAIAPAFAAMTAQAAASRLLFGMARDGRLPAVLARVHARHGVPHVALATTGLLTSMVAVWAARRQDGLALLVSIVDVGALAAFTLLHFSVVGYFVVRRKGAPRAAHYIGPVAGAIVTVWVVFEASPLAQAVGAAWALAGLAVFASRRAPSRWSPR